MAATPADEPAATATADAPSPRVAVQDATGDNASANPGPDPVAVTAAAARDDHRALSQEIAVVSGLPDRVTPGPRLDPPTGPIDTPAVDHPIANLLGPGDGGADPRPSDLTPASKEILETLGITTQGRPELLPSVAVGPPEATGSPGNKLAEAAGKSLAKGPPVDSPAPTIAMASFARSASASGPLTPVPAPSTGALLLLGLAGLGVRSRRRKLRSGVRDQ